MSDLEWPFDKTAFVGRIPLHHAHMIAGRQDYRISCGGVEKRGLASENFLGIVRLLKVVNPARTTAVAGLRSEFPAIARSVEHRLRNARNLLTVDQMAGQIWPVENLQLTRLFEVRV